MATDNLSAPLRKLRDSAKELNQLSDAVNDVFSDVEKFLQESSLGIEAWADAGKLAEKTHYLGFVQYSGRWRLCIRAMNLPSDTSNTTLVLAAMLTAESKPWENWSRDVKITAGKALPQLVQELQAQVATRLKAATAAVAFGRQALPPDAAE